MIHAPAYHGDVFSQLLRSEKGRKFSEFSALGVLFMSISPIHMELKKRIAELDKEPVRAEQAELRGDTPS